MHVPFITLRETSERREILDVGINVLIGSDPSRILDGAREMMSKKRQWPNPFGDGKGAERIFCTLGE